MFHDFACSHEPHCHERGGRGFARSVPPQVDTSRPPEEERTSSDVQLNVKAMGGPGVDRSNTTHTYQNRPIWLLVEGCWTLTGLNW